MQIKSNLTKFVKAVCHIECEHMKSYYHDFC